MCRTILVVIECGDTPRAMELSCAIAGFSDGRLVLCHVVDIQAALMAASYTGIDPRPAISARRDAGAEALRQASARAQRACVRSTSVLLVGDPCVTIGDAVRAHKVDLIVVSRAPGTMRSDDTRNASRLVRTVGKPVLIVP